MDLCDSVLCYEDIVGQENRTEKKIWNVKVIHQRCAMARMKKRMCETVKKSTMTTATTTRARYAWHMFEQGASLFDYRRIYSWYSDSHRYSTYTPTHAFSFILFLCLCLAVLAESFQYLFVARRRMSLLLTVSVFALKTKSEVNAESTHTHPIHFSTSHLTHDTHVCDCTNGKEIFYGFSKFENVVVAVAAALSSPTNPLWIYSLLRSANKAHTSNRCCHHSVCAFI